MTRPSREMMETRNPGLIQRRQVCNHLAFHQAGPGPQLFGGPVQKKLTHRFGGKPADRCKGNDRDQQIGGEKLPEETFSFHSLNRYPTPRTVSM